MTKSEFITKMADEQGITKKLAKEALDIVLTGIESACEDGEEVNFTGYFSLEKSVAPAKSGVMKQLQEDGSIKEFPWATEEHDVMKIKISKKLKEAIVK